MRPLLAATSQEERLDAALPLIALGHEAQALPVLLSAAKAEPSLQGKAALALPWRPWIGRLDLFKQLLAMNPGPEELTAIVQAMTQVRDERALAPLWELAARDPLPIETASVLLNGLRQAHFGEALNQRTGNGRVLPAADRKQAIAMATPRATTGPEMQHLIALGLLLTASPDEAAAVAGKIAADASAAPVLRRDAFKALLLSRSKVEAPRVALEGLAHAEPGVRQVAVSFLAVGATV